MQQHSAVHLAIEVSMPHAISSSLTSLLYYSIAL